MAKSLRILALKSDFLWQFEYILEKFIGFVCEMLLGGRTCPPSTFSIQIFVIIKKSNFNKTPLFDGKLGHFAIFATHF